MRNPQPRTLFGCFPIRFALAAVIALGTITGCGGRASETTSANSAPADVDHCANLGDEPAPRVMVLIENHSSLALYVGPVLAGPCYASFAIAPFEVGDEAGAGVGSDRQCGNFSCADVANGNTAVGCSNICKDHTTFTLLQPGETLKTSWLPERLARYELPLKCLRSANSALTSCTRAERVALGTTLTFSTQGGSELDCTSLPSGCGICQPSPSGGCEVQAKMPVGTVLQATSTITLDEEYLAGGPDSKVVELAFVE